MKFFVIYYKILYLKKKKKKTKQKQERNQSDMVLMNHVIETRNTKTNAVNLLKLNLD